MSPAAENTGIVVAAGESQTFSIGGVGLRIACQPGGHPLTLPGAYRLFLAPRVSADVNVRVGSTALLDSADAPVIYGGGYHWRARATGGAAGAESALCFEIFYPPTGETYCRMDGDAALSDVELVFGRENLERLPDDFTRQCEGRLWFPHPFEQIVLIPSLARRSGFLIHACGAVVNGRAFVFAGHSGDGKTTLSRLLADEGVELLSDERIAICETENGFVAHGTPWAGEGEVVSSARFPLGGIFVLRKAATHRISGGLRGGLKSGAIGNLAAEVLARSLVPYYLPEEMARILSLVKRATHQVPFGELEFTREPGLRDLLAGFESSDAVA